MQVEVALCGGEVEVCRAKGVLSAVETADRTVPIFAEPVAFTLEAAAPDITHLMVFREGGDRPQLVTPLRTPLKIAGPQGISLLTGRDEEMGAARFGFLQLEIGDTLHMDEVVESLGG